MADKKPDMSDFMALQVAEIMRFRKHLQTQSDDIITFQDAAEIWVSQGMAERFRKEYEAGRYHQQPAKA